MCNQVVTSEIRDEFKARFVRTPFSGLLPINIMGEELRWLSRIFDKFILVRIDRERHFSNV